MAKKAFDKIASGLSEVLEIVRAEPMDFERTSKPASDMDIEFAADSIMDILKEFDSPKDAGAALRMATFKMIMAMFPPKFKRLAVESVEEDAEALKRLINQGWA